MASEVQAIDTVATGPRPRGTRHARRMSLHCARSKRHATRPPQKGRWGASADEDGDKERKSKAL